ncbi:MAG: Cell-division-associated, ABC-transporter-like signaling protein FtsE [Nitrospira sp.]|jgi:cell division transport system ATP-binding protein|nr:MAG: Cell-division-associated, ABC-transporter-like signaling protein FtsE [Nitrospira sp.]
MDAIIQLIHVSKWHDRKAALSDVTLEIEKGEFVLLMGASGAGKSTLLRMLIGEEQPDEGQIFVHGRNVTKMRPTEIPYLRRKAGAVFQDFRLLPKKSVFDNVALPLIVQGASEKDIRRKVTEALRAVDVDHKKDQLPNNLSTGEQQRVCIARAIVNGPVVLLADEPTGNLDPERTREIMELFKLINARGTTVLVATHDPHVLNHVNRRVITLVQGVLLSERRIGQGVGV